MFRRRGKKTLLGWIVTLVVGWGFLSIFFKPMFSLIVAVGIAAVVAYFAGKNAGRKENGESHDNRGYREEDNPAAGTKRASTRTGTTPAAERAAQQRSTSQRKPEYAKPEPPKAEPVRPETKKSYGPEIDPLVEEGNRAMSEMGRLYMSIKDPEIRGKINEIIRITDKITQDAIEDPSDIPQIKKFFRYYLPTTIKLLNAYDRMSAQGIEGENIDKSMKNISEMLDVAIEAYKKRLDSLFENQALDIETDIDVMNQMLAREGLTGDRGPMRNGNSATFGTTGTTGTVGATGKYGTAAQTAPGGEYKFR